MAQTPKAAAEGEGPWKTAHFPDATGSQSLISLCTTGYYDS